MKPQYFLCLSLFFSLLTNAYAEKTYSPNKVFAGVEYANLLASNILSMHNIKNISIPHSRETAAKPMHVYELHVSALAELYQYAIKNERRPPPLAVSTPIKYTPTDVYYLTQLVMNNLEEIYTDTGGKINFSMKSHSGKSPANVYQELFELYYRLNLLNGKSKVSPSEVYSHIYRAKQDLQNSLRILSRRLDDSKEKQKRLLITASYGLHTDGSVLAGIEKGKTPGDVMVMVFKVRENLNILRSKNEMKKITTPNLSAFNEKIKPIDIFLQTQFIIAELNLLKIPMKINSQTAAAIPEINKTPSDVHQEMKHINYMLERIIATL